MKNSILNFVIVSNHREAQKVLDDLKEEGFDTSKCDSCGTEIINRIVERSPQNIFEKSISKIYRKKFHIWDCNFGSPIWKKNKIICNMIKCELDGVHIKLED